MRAKKEEGLATSYYVFLVGGESVCGGEWRRERVGVRVSVRRLLEAGRMVGEL